ncbi:hypothetical protein DL93DRAFT_2200881 [Clavulina sp. PMI_390]|nr:hypothetical protein DL93DRAFT_2200881 [Clavulina sp. PMI_390]
MDDAFILTCNNSWIYIYSGTKFSRTFHFPIILLPSKIMSNCTIPANPDFSGIGIRVGLYISTFLAIAFRSKLFWSVGLNGFALLVTAVAQTASHQLDLYHAVIVIHQLFPVMLLIPPPPLSPLRPWRVAIWWVTLVVVFGLSLSWSMYVWITAPSFGTSLFPSGDPRCNDSVKYTILFITARVTAPWFRWGSVAALALTSLFFLVLCAEGVYFIWFAVWATYNHEENLTLEEGSIEIDTSRKYGGWMSADEFNFLQLGVFFLWVHNVIMLELTIKRSHVAPGEELWGFGQILPVVIAIAGIINLILKLNRPQGHADIYLIFKSFANATLRTLDGFNTILVLGKVEEKKESSNGLSDDNQDFVCAIELQYGLNSFVDIRNISYSAVQANSIPTLLVSWMNIVREHSIRPNWWETTALDSLAIFPVHQFFSYKKLRTLRFILPLIHYYGHGTGVSLAFLLKRKSQLMTEILYISLRKPHKSSHTFRELTRWCDVCRKVAAKTNHCQQCPDYDECDDCSRLPASMKRHQASHTFQKVVHSCNLCGKETAKTQHSRLSLNDELPRLRASAVNAQAMTNAMTVSIHAAQPTLELPVLPAIL